MECTKLFLSNMFASLDSKKHSSNLQLEADRWLRILKRNLTPMFKTPTLDKGFTKEEPFEKLYDFSLINYNIEI